MKTIKAKFTICDNQGQAVERIEKIFFGDKAYEDINIFKESQQTKNSFEGFIVTVMTAETI